MPLAPEWIRTGLARMRRATLRITSRRLGPGVGLLRVEGRLLRPGLRLFWKHAAQRLSWGEGSLLVDLRRCDELSASGAVACMILDLECRQSSGRLVLVTETGGVPAVFARIGAEPSVCCVATEAEALAALRLCHAGRELPA